MKLIWQWSIYLANTMDVRQIREEVTAVRELVDHQFHHMQQERSTVSCVLHIRHSTQVLQVKGFQLEEGEGKRGEREREGVFFCESGEEKRERHLPEFR